MPFDRLIYKERNEEKRGLAQFYNKESREYKEQEQFKIKDTTKKFRIHNSYGPY